MKKIAGFLFIVFFVLNNMFAQVNKDGLPFYTKYTDKDYGAAGQIWAITQDNRGVMYFGCNYGLKTYDGKTWKSYNNEYSTRANSLVSDNNGSVYYGAEGDFGVFLNAFEGKTVFHSLYLDKFSGDSINFGTVWKTLIADNKVYFQAFEELFYCDLPLKFDKDTILINPIKVIKPQSLFHLSFSVDNNFYIRDREKGLCRVVNDKLELIPGGEMFALLRVYVMLPFDDHRILIGTREKGFFLFDKTKKNNAITPFNLENNEEIINSAIYNGVKLPDGNFAIGTFADGIFIFNKSGKILNHFNTQTGLPSPYILTLYMNENNQNPQLWFVNGDNGIFRADIFNPFTVWGKPMGIEGTVNDIIDYKGNIYVADNNNLLLLNTKSLFPNFKNIYSENQNIWKFLKFNIPGSKKSKLLMASVSGLYEIKDTVVSKIADIYNVHALFQSVNIPNRLYIGSDEGISYIEYSGNSWSELTKREGFNNSVSSILENDKYLGLGIDAKGIIILDNFEDKNITLLDSSKGLPLLGAEYFLHKCNNQSVIINGSGLHYITDSLSVEPFNFFGNEYCNKKNGVFSFIEDDDAYWMSVYSNDENNLNHRLIRFLDKKKRIKDSVFAKILPQKSTLCIYPDKNYVWISNEGGLFKFNKKTQKNFKAAYNTIISKVITVNDSVLFKGNFTENNNGTILFSLKQPKTQIPELDFKNNKLIFEWAAPFFEKETEIEYCFRLVGESDKWSKWSKKADTRFTNLYEGDYTFEVKAKNIYNTESSIAQYSFTILPPWYRTIWAYILFLIAGVFAIILIIKLYTKKLKRENEKLEQIVKERTAEIRMQNEEITAQRDEIQAQKDVVEQAKDKIEKQQKSIMDSIHYASRIQEAVLPPDDYLNKILGEHFVLFRPRDIVSGDFYWATESGSKTVIVAADCTGHGVPGAFMSMLGMSFLNEIVNKDRILQANVILNRLRENVKKSLRQTGKENEAKDGMDIAVCIIDKTEMKIQFAGAYNPLLIIRDGEISRIKADRMPIGIYLREKESFTNNIIDVKKGDLLYIFSDGYVDQFGGENDSKIRSAKFKEILIENHKKSLAEQKAGLVKFLEEWMNHTDDTGRKYKQVDDILVIGIEI